MFTPGHIFLTGIGVLANARPVDNQRGNRNVAFDVNFPLQDGKKRALALLHYFTPEYRMAEIQKAWDNDFTQAVITARIAAMPERGIPTELLGEEEPSDYAFIGDITEIILTEGANIHRHPYLMATGNTIAYDTNNHTFSLTPCQYIGLTCSTLPFPITCSIDADSNKWKTKKPTPTTGSTISIGGYFEKVKRDVDKNPTFEIELESIAYLSRQPTLHGGLPRYPSSSIATSHNRFNYDDPIASSSSTVVLGKRKDDGNKKTMLNDNDDDHKEKRAHTFDLQDEKN